MLSDSRKKAKEVDIGRLQLRVRGQVQGVGFRPFIHRLAAELSITGWVLNDVAGVLIEAWANPAILEEFAQRISSDAPPLAQIDSVTLQQPQDMSGEPPSAFVILESDTGSDQAGRITVDSAVCSDCLAEMSDAEDRRFGHGLINCTNCGPRYSIIRDLPYDRPRTTMAGFPMCQACEVEYRDPSNRRFHAQPTCCPECGPSVFFVSCDGKSLGEGNPFAAARAFLEAGQTLAMKGLGGFHLVVDATNRAAVQSLRERKKRDHKPFALMVRDYEVARDLCQLDDAAIQALASPAAPIVIAPKRPGGATLAPEVAPGQHRLGVMLPNTPMQHLLAAECTSPLVMTSANLSDEPLVKDDEEALERLSAVADAFLTHDRPIERAVDDSVAVTDEAGKPLVVVRRARGMAPQPLPLPVAAAGVGLCCGADLKNSVALVRNGEAVLSQHVGDLSYTLAYDRFTETVTDLERLLDIQPDWVAVDQHPRYLSRQYGVKRSHQADGREVQVIEVQHHHAHLASLLAEHQRNETIVGIICDGVGFGLDGTAWGGEILLGGLASFERVGHIRPLRLPGGDAAAKQTGRCAFSWMVDVLGLAEALEHPLAAEILAANERMTIASMLEADLQCPPSSGLGRLFDAAAALLGLCDFNHHEAMSGQLLESAASRSPNSPSGGRLMTLGKGPVFAIDTRPLGRRIVNGIGEGELVDDLAWLFHDAVADGLARAAISAAGQACINVVGLSGGVFCNLLLTRLMANRLESAGMEVLTHHQIPPNDGGIALGQAAIAAMLSAAEK